MARTNSLTSGLLQSESDDEESFVVLGHSLPPESLTVDCLYDAVDANVVQESLKLTNGALSQLRESSSSFPSLPKVDPRDLILPTGEENCVSNSIHSSVDLGPDEIQQKVDSLVKENIKLKETLQQNNLAMKKQYDTLMLWQADVQKVHQSHKEKFAETKKYIENLKLENAKLIDALKVSQSTNSKVLEELDRLQNQKQDFKCLSDSSGDGSSQKSEFVSVKNLEPQSVVLQAQNQQLLQTPSAVEIELSKTVEDLQKDLSSAKQLNAQISADYDKKLIESESLQKILLQEIKMLKTQLKDKLGSAISKEDHKIVQEQLIAAQMHLTNLELQRNEDKDTINAKEETIVTLQESLKEMEESKDTITALRAQLELYKSDFEAERQAKESLKSEKSQIAEDLQHLQRRNQQLLEEVERLRNGDFVHVNPPDLPQSSPSAPQDSPPPRTYACPLCMTRFRTLRLVEDHVEYCLHNTP